MPHLTDAQKSRLKKLFDSFQKKEAGTHELETVSQNEDAIKHKAEKGFLSKFTDEIFNLLDMVRAVVRRDYTEISKNNLAAIVFTLIYVLSPLDVIPDVVPAVGLLDDAAMVALCLKLVRDAVVAYKKWKAQTGGVLHIIEEKTLDAVQELIEPSVRSFCVQAIAWSCVGLVFSVAGIVVLFAKPFPAVINDDIAFVIFDVTLVITVVRLIVAAVCYRKEIARFWKNWKAARGEANRVQKAVGRTILIPVTKNSVARFTLEKIGGITVTDDCITLDDIFVLKNKLPLGEINEHFPDVLSVAKYYARRLRVLVLVTTTVLAVSSVFVGILLKQFAIAAASDTTFLQRLWVPFFHVWQYIRGLGR
ncbi:MAG: DUF1232 domain-containing protein [Treponema sp.]|nr:DUF1232 domain-containing protein [Treponema sp.]